MNNSDKEKIDILWNKEAYYQLIEDCQGLNDFANNDIINKIKDFISTNNLNKILDVGCGEGGVINYLSGGVSKDVKFYGLEVAEAGLRRARDRRISNTEFQSYDGKTIPFADGVFDLCFSTFVFEHLTDPERVFGEMTRVTKKDGYVIIACPNYGSAFFHSPCNKNKPLFLMFHRLFQGILPSFIFKNSFKWQKVEPIVLQQNEHIMDYDTTAEPNLLFVKKYLSNYKETYELAEATSFWNNYEYGGKSMLKKIFLSSVKFLGKNGFPVVRYYGPFFFIIIKKLK